MPKRLYWATESRFQRGPDGAIRSPHPGDSYDGYAPMLEHFDEVAVLARVATVDTVAGVEVEGDRIRVCPLPNYVGVKQAAVHYCALEHAIEAQALDPEGHYAGKLPGLICARLARLARKQDRPFLVNVVGDPQDVLTTGTLGKVAALGAPLARVIQRRLVRSADSVVYVSEGYLQERYPVRKGVPQLARSNVRLPEAAFAPHNHHPGAGAPFRLITVGSQDQLYKGHDLLIEAIGRLRADGVRVELHLIGAGRRQGELRQRARQRSVEGSVIFHGHVGELTKLRALLDESDLYVQPSRTEGVPRALIEAMARQLPCLGSSAGGIPELLDRSAVFAIDDLEGLVHLIETYRNCSHLRTEQGIRNQARASEIAELVDPARYAAFLGQFARMGQGTASDDETP